MKKLLWISLALLCNEALASLTITSTLEPISFLVDRVGGDLVTVKSVITKGQNPHNFTISPRLAEELSKSDAYFTIGFPLEEKLTSLVDKNKIKSIDDGIVRLPGDFHFWTSIENLRTFSKNITRELIKLDPKNQEIFEENESHLILDLGYLENKVRKLLSPLKGKTVVAYHSSFDYLVHPYGLVVREVEEAGKEPTIKQLSVIANDIKQQKINYMIVDKNMGQEKREKISKILAVEPVVIDILQFEIIDGLATIAEEIFKHAAASNK